MQRTMFLANTLFCFPCDYLFIELWNSWVKLETTGNPWPVGSQGPFSEIEICLNSFGTKFWVNYLNYSYFLSRCGLIDIETVGELGSLQSVDPFSSSRFEQNAVSTAASECAKQIFNLIWIHGWVADDMKIPHPEASWEYENLLPPYTI